MQRVVFPWLVPDDPTSLRSFLDHADLITHVSPNWFRINGAGEITSRFDNRVLDLARQHQVSVHPLIANEGLNTDVARAVLATRESRQQAAQSIARLVFEHDFDGINVDFEGDFGDRRTEYIDFLRQITAELRPAGKWLSVDVFPERRSPAETGEVSPFDFAALSDVCDRIIMMGYDYSVEEPGPIAPAWWLEDAIDHALTQIPAEQLIVGLPFYNRHWITGANGKTRRVDLSHEERARLLQSVARGPAHDERDDTCHATWSDAEGEHYLAYGDATTFDNRLQIVRSRGINGIALWRLGQETNDYWASLTRA